MKFPPLQYFNAASTITSAGALFSLAGILFAAKGEREWASTALFLAITCDHFDGLIARRFNQQSEFGAQLDSLVDALSFCVAPVLISWHLGYQGILAGIIMSAYLLAGLWRLAMYNIAGLDESGKTPRYVGMPTTNAAAWWLIMAALLGALVSGPALKASLWSVFFVATALLMVSTVRVPKRGLYVHIHLLLVPVAVIIIWVTA